MRYNRDLLVIASDVDGAPLWLSQLQEQHWNPTLIAGLDHLEAAISESAPAVILLSCDNRSPQEIKELFYHCLTRGEGAAVVPVVSGASVQDVLGYIRTGAADVLVTPVERQELLSVVERAADSKRLVLERSRYRDQLERTNQELQESLRVLQQDQIAGRQVQQSMLPKTPQRFGDYTIAHHIVPSLYLSGDFVGYNAIFDRYLTFYFADVSGHGASSAFVTVLLRFMLNRINHRHAILQDHANLARAPEGLAESLNRQLIATGLDKHMTLFAGVIDMHTHRLRYINGSQMPAPILKTPDGASVLNGKGKPIGLFEGVNWTVYEAELPEQFSLTVVSDGIFDFINGDNLVDKEQYLFDVVSGNSSSLDSVVQKLGLADINDAPDDISVLLVSRGM